MLFLSFVRLISNCEVEYALDEEGGSEERRVKSEEHLVVKSERRMRALVLVPGSLLVPDGCRLIGKVKERQTMQSGVNDGEG